MICARSVHFGEFTPAERHDVGREVALYVQSPAASDRPHTHSLTPGHIPTHPHPSAHWYQHSGISTDSSHDVSRAYTRVLHTHRVCIGPDVSPRARVQGFRACVRVCVRGCRRGEASKGGQGGTRAPYPLYIAPLHKTRQFFNGSVYREQTQ